ncbi:hypothetical protein HZH66_013986 [Vespula vulgaris]|uniref:PiggyBac transposable element-derived protein domain-containing protein n=1 Tax=Vespula vulgaris TaxID=7454 RepID=A0A834J522_VESVU|nr:hypothetical protein HZH66_013986 [Vespula vulgaris]
MTRFFFCFPPLRISIDQVEGFLQFTQTKFGVNIADQMAKKCNVKSGSRRWPLEVFFNIVDLAGINAWILYKERTNTQKRFYVSTSERTCH